jgi:hypothetical protein
VLTPAVIASSRRRLGSTPGGSVPIQSTVEHASARPAGGRRRFATPLLIAFAALVVAAPAAGGAPPDVTVDMPVQLPKVQLPLKDGAAGDVVPGGVVEDVVGDVVEKPLPQPVEDVVESSPVAPVRDEVRRVVRQAAGGGGGGSGGGGSSGGTGSGSGTGSAPGAGTGGGSNTPNGGSGNSGRDRSGDGGRGNRAPRRTGAGRGAALRGATGLTPGRGAGTGPTAGARDRAEARNERPSRADDQSAPAAAIRTIKTVVTAVPAAIWIALGVLSLLALALAGRTWVERRNARALARDRDQLIGDVAALERALLPAVPERLGAVCASVAYRSCDGPAAGGDFYDAFELPGGRAAVIVGDVSGHGPDALEGTNSVRSQLHALLETGMSPRAAVAAVGERSPVQLAGRFSTVVVAVHDPADGTLTYATAGHAPPIVVGPGAEELLSVGASPPVGVGLRTGLRETTVALPPGSTCCLYTDGLVEAKKGDGMIGRERFAAMVAALGPDDQADALLDRVIAEADVTGDDMTVCVLRPVAGAQARTPRVEVMQLDADDIDSGFAARFLDACGVPEDESAVTLEQARAEVSAGGLALIEITMGNGMAGTRVTVAPESAAYPNVNA